MAWGSEKDRKKVLKAIAKSPNGLSTAQMCKIRVGDPTRRARELKTEGKVTIRQDSPPKGLWMYKLNV